MHLTFTICKKSNMEMQLGIQIFRSNINNQNEDVSHQVHQNVEAEKCGTLSEPPRKGFTRIGDFHLERLHIQKRDWNPHNPIPHNAKLGFGWYFKELGSKKTLFCKECKRKDWFRDIYRSRKDLLITRDRDVGWSWIPGISNGMSWCRRPANLSESRQDRGTRAHGPSKNSWNEGGLVCLCTRILDLQL